MKEKIRLPGIPEGWALPLDECLKRRKSSRLFTGEPLSLDEASIILWSAGCVKDDIRTAPSACAIYPTFVYLYAGNVTGLERGLYRYDRKGHILELVLKKDLSTQLLSACLNQWIVHDAPAVVLITADYSKISRRFGSRAERFIALEAGHMAQNVYLACASLSIGVVAVGSFFDEGVMGVLSLDGPEHPIYLLPFGRCKGVSHRR